MFCFTLYKNMSSIILYYIHCLLCHFNLYCVSAVGLWAYSTFHLEKLKQSLYTAIKQLICHESGKGYSFSYGGSSFTWQTYLSSVLFMRAFHALSVALPAPLMAFLWIIKHSWKKKNKTNGYFLYCCPVNHSSLLASFILVIWLNSQDQISHHQHHDVVLFVLPGLYFLSVWHAWLLYTCDPVTRIPSLISKDDHGCNLIRWHILKGL